MQTQLLFLLPHSLHFSSPSLGWDFNKSRIFLRSHCMVSAQNINFSDLRLTDITRFGISVFQFLSISLSLGFCGGLVFCFYPSGGLFVIPSQRRGKGILGLVLDVCGCELLMYRNLHQSHLPVSFSYPPTLKKKRFEEKLFHFW